jgi:hypothetical protein
MITELAIKWIAGGILLAALSGGVYLVEQKIESRGYAKAEAKYTLIIDKYNKDVASKIDTIYTNSGILVAKGDENTLKLTKDISKIVSNLKGKTLTVIKNGECVPTSTFSDSFSEINKRANQSLKESQK